MRDWSTSKTRFITAPLGQYVVLETALTVHFKPPFIIYYILAPPDLDSRQKIFDDDTFANYCNNIRVYGARY